MALRLYLGVGPGKIHTQHLEKMSELGSDGWELSDKYVSSSDIKLYDALDIPYPDGSVDTIYNSHLLEHIGFRRAVEAVKHWYSKLKFGGKICINVPDIEWACRKFLDILEAERQMKFDIKDYYNLSLDYEDFEHSFLQIFFGSEAHEGEFHKNAFSKESIKKLLEVAGFKNIEVEQVFEAHQMGCLIATAVK